MINYFSAGKNDTIGGTVWFRRWPWFHFAPFSNGPHWYVSFGWLWWCVQFGDEPKKLPEPERRRLALYWIGKQRLENAPEEFTCWECSRHGDCDSAWDGYNTNDDCLEMK